MTQLIPQSALVRRPLTAPDAGTVPDLRRYDVIAVSTSGGKDSQASLSYVVRLAIEQGVLDRVVAIHADLGDAEWDGTGEVARAQCEHLGVPMRVTTRIGGRAPQTGKTYSKGEVFGDILDYATRRGSWPSSTARWCTSEFKRGPVLREFTALAKLAKRQRRIFGRAVRILDVMGLRSEESPAREKLPQFEAARVDTKNQLVDTWLPLKHWRVGHVWQEIERSGAPVHPAYNLGMPRLSCVFCIFSPRAALKLAGRHNRKLLDQYVAVEDRIKHRFRMDVSLREVRDALDAEPATATETIADWAM